MPPHRTIGLLVTLIIYITPLFYHDEPTPQMISSKLGLAPDLKFTFPIPCHSHNDYWRERPLYSAISAGCVGVEADVWPLGDSLHVGHNLGELDADRTLYSMYIEPLERVLMENNADRSGGPLRGVYSREPDQTLVLLIDVKSHPEAAWELLLQELEPLRQKGWLSRVVDNTFVMGPITIVGTGDTTLEMVEKNPFSDTFLDAPLDKLREGNYSLLNSYYSSVSFRQSIGRLGLNGLNPHQTRKLREQIRTAHERGLQVRYWGMPYWPLHARNDLWSVLMDEGVDVLNVDDLMAARETCARRRRLTD